MAGGPSHRNRPSRQGQTALTGAFLLLDFLEGTSCTLMSKLHNSSCQSLREAYSQDVLKISQHSSTLNSLKLQGRIISSTRVAWRTWMKMRRLDDTIWEHLASSQAGGFSSGSRSSRAYCDLEKRGTIAKGHES